MLAFLLAGVGAGLADDLFVDQANPACVWVGAREVIDFFGDGQGNTLSYPRDVAVDAQGNVFVTGNRSDNVFRVAPDGSILEIIDATGDGAGNRLDGANAVDVDAAGNVYVTGTNSDNVFRITPSGVIDVILDATGDGQGNVLDGPAGIAVGVDGRVYVAGERSHNVFEIDTLGVVTERIDATGDGIHPLTTPHDVAVDGSGNLFVVGLVSDNAFWVDSAGTVAQILDASGDGAGNLLDAPTSVGVSDAGDVSVVGSASNNVFRIDANGGVVKILDASGDGAGNPMAAAWGLLVDPDGTVFVSDLGTGSSDNAGVFRVDESGTVDFLWGASFAEGPYFAGCRAMALTPGDRLMVVCERAGAVIEARSSLATVSGVGTMAVPFCGLWGAVDGARAGDVIHIAPGDYFGASVVIDRDVTLLGSGADDTELVGGKVRYGGRFPTVHVRNGASVAIDGLTLSWGLAGLIIDPSSQVCLTNSTVSDNYTPNPPVYRGAGIRNGGTATLHRVSVTRNKVNVYPGYFGIPEGGGIFNSGTMVVTSSVISNNTSSGWGAGGGISNHGDLTVRDSLLAGNLNSGSFAYFSIAPAAYNLGTLALSNCTVTGNDVRVPGYNPLAAIVSRAGDVLIEDSIVWGNNGLGPVPAVSISGSAVTVDRSVVENGWSGAGSNNLTLDPLFKDAPNGDYSLLPGSPCIDAGDPAAQPTGLDLAESPRLIDGDLDRVMRVDMGAYEFAHVALGVTGTPTPGGTLTATATGSPGFIGVLALGLRPMRGGHLLPPFGTAFFGGTDSIVLVPLGALPSSKLLTIPPTIQTPFEGALQVLGIGPPVRTGRRAGNLSNPVPVTIQ